MTTSDHIDPMYIRYADQGKINRGKMKMKCSLLENYEMRCFDCKAKNRMIQRIVIEAMESDYHFNFC